MAEPHVVSALREKRAQLAGELQLAEQRVDQLRADLVHLDATLRLFDPATDPNAIRPKRPYQRREWFKDHELPRLIIQTLGASPEPLTATEITSRIMAAKGMEAGDNATLRPIRNCVQGYLRRQSGKLVVSAGSAGKHLLWRVAEG